VAKIAGIPEAILKKARDLTMTPLQALQFLAKVKEEIEE
jgi:hypothetical protein